MSTDPKIFDSSTYGGLHSPFTDGSDNLANTKEQMIGFHHVPSKTDVYFKAFITAFNESYSSDWNSENVYGRIDPIYMFKNTTRTVTLAFKVPCSTTGEAYGNLARVQTLLQFLYPTYEESNSATTITQSPLVRIKLMNLLAKTLSGSAPSDLDGPALYARYTSTSDADQGLLGVIRNVAVNHNLENTEIGVIEKGPNTILPKMIEINLDFAVIHEEHLGWENESFRSQLFPYNAPRMEPTSPAEPTVESESASAGESNSSDGVEDDTNTDISQDGAPEVTVGSEEDEEAANPTVSDQDIANAEARYSGLFGNARLNADIRKSYKGTLNKYEASALAGAGAGTVRTAGDGTKRSDADYTITRRTQRWYNK